MKRNTLRAPDAINGAQAKCTMEYEGRIEDLFYAKNLDATITKHKTELKVLGQTGAKHKANGWTGKGKLSMYFVTTLFRKIMLDYAHNGKDMYFTIITENEDPSSALGIQKIALLQVNFDAVVISKFDINSTELDEEMEFTFNDVAILNEFNQVIPE